MMNTQRTAVAGIGLIALGLVWWLSLWWLILPAALVGGGLFGYLQRRARGRLHEGLQIALWGVGLGILFLLNFVWPGVLFLAGASILLRGREDQVQTVAKNALARIRPSRSASRSSSVPIETVVVQPTYGDTTRLHEK